MSGSNLELSTFEAETDRSLVSGLSLSIAHSASRFCVTGMGAPKWSDQGFTLFINKCAMPRKGLVCHFFLSCFLIYQKVHFILWRFTKLKQWKLLFSWKCINLESILKLKTSILEEGKLSVFHILHEIVIL